MELGAVEEKISHGHLNIYITKLSAPKLMKKIIVLHYFKMRFDVNNVWNNIFEFQIWQVDVTQSITAATSPSNKLVFIPYWTTHT